MIDYLDHNDRHSLNNVVTFIHWVSGEDNMSTFTSREFNQDTGRAKKDALNGPVFITDRGKPSYVLMTYEQYNLIVNKQKTIGELLHLDGVSDIEFEPVLLGDDAVGANF